MTSSLIENTETHYRFDRWRERNRLPGSLVARRFQVRRGVLGDWKRLRTTDFRREGGPRLAYSVWTREDEPGAILRVSIVETRSLADAHAEVVKMLASMQSRRPEPMEEDPHPGDVAFATETGSVCVFARGNLVVTVAVAGTETADAREIGLFVDREIIGDVEQVTRERVEGAALSAAPSAETCAAGQARTVAVDEPPEEAEPGWQRFFTPHGNLAKEEEGVTFESSTQGRAQVTVDDVSKNGEVVRRKVFFDVR